MKTQNLHNAIQVWFKKIVEQVNQECGANK